MTIFRIICQLIAMLGITTTEEDTKLLIDVGDYETSCQKEDATKFQQIYAKIHKGIYFRLASPFILIYLKRWADTMLNGTVEKDGYKLD